jgi:hypothetical protein
VHTLSLIQIIDVSPDPEADLLKPVVLSIYSRLFLVLPTNLLNIFEVSAFPISDAYSSHCNLIYSATLTILGESY